MVFGEIIGKGLL